ncbi:MULTISPECIES: bifunctional diaminohydroxyphosphoribosylaminopyrimidine deaminase/5-amino-6-(5-phosphoribosylamino)uracil reductase RibD [unclassified Rhizobium]|uniref:bifunctional diaminohydroxyphosphoribosylaminopyrimidine deaminase/5-amino-6-(5-phosphoribosylamino)uracil reductase RibD n=1 Tax=unclassified Rhizobium TaxID=2613769 RepID=UPI00160DE57E|nr:MULTISPECIES: bifunctional diaminohydroxyphosphoribosylaminopyrimidine deaminase/5-amino-6-(5-phosphoribosylamino)uracil reductase RibD [unclassified Rhizobium]MBB3539537.1 diaminohydroxyphosphoribosylaminopyrimidine deaminase/5-amino-6-(5-phosphoribosylamino)uracil reductase [Rhizobium sp. BK399]MCS3741073.1 diaminohydroxyphosphoribosylaminopyrimidine deaminase/5-amino-6-(5-phosphoribosylamino)uracil reductase [Rhizobium sp. BK661]MCS4093238.1 diaminohydroxyphosphoribosylaminopyrimidine deam
MSASEDDARFMQEAIRLGLLHLGQTSTNPSVGCVIVRDGQIVGRAVTAVGGRPHAEPQALAEAGERARGATAYVTLEPCSHYGKTPPCAEALIAYGVGRVVISVTDPDPRVSGKGISMLRDAGIEVESGILEEEGRRSLAAYLTRQTKNRPYVTLKLAVSADGMIGKRGEGQVAITGPAARAEVQKLRAEADAILVGIGTAVADDPLLTVRTPGLETRSPVRVVLDEHLSLPLDSKLVATARQVPLIVVATEPPRFDNSEDKAFLARRDALDQAGVEVVQCNPNRLDELLPALASRGISSLVVEGGARTAKLFLDAGYVDRILLYQGPEVIGQDGIESPVTKTDMPSDLLHRGTFIFGDDRLDEYEREL